MYPLECTCVCMCKIISESYNLWLPPVLFKFVCTDTPIVIFCKKWSISSFYNHKMPKCCFLHFYNSNTQLLSCLILIKEYKLVLLMSLFTKNITHKSILNLKVICQIEAFKNSLSFVNFNFTIPHDFNNHLQRNNIYSLLYF